MRALISGPKLEIKQAAKSNSLEIEENIASFAPSTKKARDPA
jgi:hypothetical protein